MVVRRQIPWAASATHHTAAWHCGWMCVTRCGAVCDVQVKHFKENLIAVKEEFDSTLFADEGEVAGAGAGAGAAAGAGAGTAAASSRRVSTKKPTKAASKGKSKGKKGGARSRSSRRTVKDDDDDDEPMEDAEEQTEDDADDVEIDLTPVSSQDDARALPSFSQEELSEVNRDALEVR